ncbi:polysaccharide biosynthesis tyrosine autokinase [Aureimonas phyllosphaerae]|uniref:Succinoglycan biosynthesis transport protein ExoP n=1 Tax=Aureimonas phyllosphaerae TaxID=1166078 RepID=A0A7W6BU16_9HYPH|nr:polysaccharide biosynthesis tyrosine autokinase [Aureimonas phyllosphaerae]MBB3938018.1 succinoglycan biosynthesis transport protein ExoP [Aureimonas phyllosphaerae]MBB3962025.1 succinoglycan biosynthesis transport protein ExoP [Aureimonas phyllosphaerae]SFF53999.1 succinoglycan biosynthesis transport protein ExoP [Aureimonas phyllosphaerae]
MLHYPEMNARETSVAMAEKDGSGDFIDFDRILAMVRRQIWVVVIGIAVGMVIGAAYLMSAVPVYTASTDILIDKGQSKLVDELATASGVFQDEAEMLSQVELLKSRQIASAVVRELKLDENDAFLAGSPSPLRSIRVALSGVLSAIRPELAAEGVDETAARRDAAIDNLQANVDVARVGQTYVLRLTYTSPDAALSARIARAYGSAYLDDQLQAKYAATRRASTWLQDRIAELRQQSYDADLAVQQFRNDNGLLASGAGLVSQQELGEINSQLVAARAQTAEAKAQLDQIERLISDGRTDAVVNDALASSTINSLRNQYLEAARRESEITRKLGPDHVQAVRLKAEMREYERLIFGELRRIAESYRSTYSVSQERERSLEASLADIRAVNADDNTLQVRLRELERESEAYRSLYDDFLQRYQQTVQQQSFPITDARIITDPTVPENPSAPRKLLVMALFAGLGAAAGGAVSGLREYRERFFRVGSQVRSELDMEFLGFMPLVDAGEAKGGEPGPASRLWPGGALSTYVRRRPMSSFAETLRNIKVAADLNMPNIPSKVIGIVSCVPSEGKSSVAASLGNLLALQGARTLLIDGDIRNPGLTRSLDTKPERGLVEVIIDNADPDEALLWESSIPLAVLPTILKSRVSNTSDVLASAKMAQILAQFREKFEYVIVDLPPVGPVVDAKAFASRVDGFVFVVEWGRTSRQLVRSAMGNSPVFRNHSLGVVLNKADSKKMKFYRSYGSPEYYASRYESYYRN